ncbi:MAG: phosphoribosylformylglycinamidine synthase subunit PurQ [Candidatus Natronoplasma sp.]
MKREDIKAAVLRIEGTNCEEESHLAFKRLGAQAEKVHLKQLLSKEVDEEEERSLKEYDIVMIPGGFSAGDYIRAGAIFGARIKSALGEELKSFVEAGKPVLGVCNGFQILVEIGVLPGKDEIMSNVPKAALETNDSNKFECRPTLLEVEDNTNCVFTRNYEEKETVLYPSAHKEGKFVLSEDKFVLSEEVALQELKDNDQIVFRYTTPDGSEPRYPWDPNGSLDHIAGICNPDGNVLGLMPHPERVFDPYTNPDWTRKGLENSRGDGRLLFESVLEYVENNF